MTSTQGWIKREEGQDITWPALLAVADTGQVHCFRSAYEMKQVEPLHQLYTHWQPATLPEPPKKELTQRERDEGAWKNWYSANAFATRFSDESWHAALAYRDKQNRGDVETIRDAFSNDLTCSEVESYNSLRRRCGLDQ